MPLVEVHLNARLQPMHRGERYEEPLQELLTQRAPGTEVTGGGTLTNEDGEPLSCDFEIDLALDRPEATELAHGLVRVLEHLGAPRGSRLAVDGAEPVEFGATEGVGVYLNGTDLPDDVYANNDVNELIDQLLQRLGDAGSLQSWWEGNRESALYFYGPSAAQIRELTADVLASHPLAQQCRVVDIT